MRDITRRSRRRLALVLCALAVTLGLIAPVPTEAGPLCGRVVIYYWNGTPIGASGYAALSCGCYLVQWGTGSTEQVVVDDYCPNS